MGETMFVKKKDAFPKLVVECENMHTLAAVAKAINESGLNAKVFMEYDIVHTGERKNEKA